MTSVLKTDSITAATDNTNLVLTGSGTGQVVLGDSSLILPDTDGTSGQFLQTNGSGTLSFADAGGGKINQVIQTVKSDTFSQSGTSFSTITGLTVDITPSSTSSKLLVLGDLKIGTQAFNPIIQLMRDTTVIYIADAAGNRPRATIVASWYSGGSDYYGLGGQPVMFLDSPATTSQVTYSFQMRSYDGSITSYLNRTHSDRDTAHYEPRTTSSLTVMEVLA